MENKWIWDGMANLGKMGNPINKWKIRYPGKWEMSGSGMDNPI